MKCEKCGAELNKNANFCRVCGSQVSSTTLENNHSDMPSEKDVSTNEKKQLSSTEEKLVKDEIVVSDSSNEIKKILDEMTIDKKSIDEPTTAIPTELINKYCKNNISEVKESSKPTLDNKEHEVKEELKNDVSKLEKNDVKEEVELKKNDAVAIMKKEEVTDINVVTKNEEKPLNSPKEELKKDSKKIELKQSNINLEEKKEYKAKVLNERENNTEEIVFANKSKKSEKVHYGRNFLIFFIILICLCAICYLVYVLYGSRNELEKIDKEKLSLQEEILTLKSTNNFNNEQIDGVIFNGYKFSSITNNYIIENDSLILNVNNFTYSIKINKNINFETIKNKKDAYIQQLIGDGYKIISYGNKHIEDNDYYVIVVSNNKSNKFLVAYTRLDENCVIAFVISNKDNTIDYASLNKSNAIISSISKNIANDTEDLNVFVEKK